MTLRGIIFDLGWTLVDFAGDVERAKARRARDIGAFLRGRGFEVDGAAVFDGYREEMRALDRTAGELHYEYPARLAMLRALRRHLSRADAAELVGDVVTVSFESLIPRWQLFPDALDTLATLRDDGYRLGCISNTNDGAHAWRIVERCGLRPWLSPIYMSEEVGLRKPHPAIFERVLEDWGLPPEQVVMVGDTLDADVLGAHNVGMGGVWVDRGSINPWTDNRASRAYIQPDATIRQLAELPDALDRL